MTCGNTIARLLILALLLQAVLLPACASRSGPGRGKTPAILSSPVGPTLKALWEASGGIETCRKFESVRFECGNVFTAGALDELPPDALANMRAGRNGPEILSFRLGEWDAIEIGQGDDRRDLPLRAPHRPELADYTRRTARIFFLFPFHLLDPVWEFRRDIVAGERLDPWKFTLVPAGASTPHEGYLVELEPKTGLLKAVTYKVEHPIFRGKIFMAVFGKYEMVHGIQVATEIEHFLCDPRREPSDRYPWDPSPAESADASERQPPAGLGGDRSRGQLVFRESFSRIEFTERSREEPEIDDGGSPR